MLFHGHLLATGGTGYLLASISQKGILRFSSRLANTDQALKLLEQFSGKYKSGSSAFMEYVIQVNFDKAVSKYYTSTTSFVFDGIRHHILLTRFGCDGFPSVDFLKFQLTKFTGATAIDPQESNHHVPKSIVILFYNVIGYCIIHQHKKGKIK